MINLSNPTGGKFLFSRTEFIFAEIMKSILEEKTTNVCQAFCFQIVRLQAFLSLNYQ